MAGEFSLNLSDILFSRNDQISSEAAECDPEVQSCENEVIDFSDYDPTLQCIDEYVTFQPFQGNLKLELPDVTLNLTLFKIDF